MASRISKKSQKINTTLSDGLPSELSSNMSPKASSNKASNESTNKSSKESTNESTKESHKDSSKSYRFLETITGYTSQEFGKDSSSIFIDTLSKAKNGVILFLILLTIIYNLKFSQKWYAQTLFNNPKFTERIILDGILAGLLGVVSTFTVLSMRNKHALDSKHLKTYFIIFIILALFAIAKESSGLNKYLNDEVCNPVNTSQKIRTMQIMKNPKCVDRAKAILGRNYKKYNSIKLTDPTECLTMKEVNSGGNPFLKSICTFAVWIVSIYVLKLIITMVASAYYGYDKNPIGNINYALTNSSSGRTIIFLFETIIVVGLINSISPFISPIIRNKKINDSAFVTSGFTFILATSLQVLFQYSGIYAD